MITNDRIGELEKKMIQAIERNKRYIDIHSDHPQVKEKQSEKEGENRAFQAMIDSLRGCDVLLDTHASGMIGQIN